MCKSETSRNTVGEMTLDRVKGLFGKKAGSAVYLQWDGVVYRDEDFFVRYDKLFLMLVHSGGFMKIPGCLCKNENGEPCILYTTDQLYRIVSGARANRILPDCPLLSGETREVAGIRKRLEYGKRGCNFNVSRSSDRFFLEILSELNPNTAIPFVLPDWYLTCRPENRNHVFCRKMSSDGPVPSSQAGRDALMASLKTSAGAGRDAYPFSRCFGKGVIASGCEAMGKWMVSSVQEVQRDLPHLKIKLHV